MEVIIVLEESCNKVVMIEALSHAIINNMTISEALLPLRCDTLPALHTHASDREKEMYIF